MQTIKLHEATRQFGISNKLAMFFLEKKNAPVKSHSSVISIDQLESLREFASNQEDHLDIIEEFEQIERDREKDRRDKEKDVKKPRGDEEEIEPIKEETTIPPYAASPITISPEKPKDEIKIKIVSPEPFSVAIKPGEKIEADTAPTPKVLLPSEPQTQPSQPHRPKPQPPTHTPTQQPRPQQQQQYQQQQPQNRPPQQQQYQQQPQNRPPQQQQYQQQQPQTRPQQHQQYQQQQPQNRPPQQQQYQQQPQTRPPQQQQQYQQQQPQNRPPQQHQQPRPQQQHQQQPQNRPPQQQHRPPQQPQPSNFQKTERPQQPFHKKETFEHRDRNGKPQTPPPPSPYKPPRETPDSTPTAKYVPHEKHFKPERKEGIELIKHDEKIDIPPRFEKESTFNENQPRPERGKPHNRPGKKERLKMKLRMKRDIELEIPPEELPAPIIENLIDNTGTPVEKSPQLIAESEKIKIKPKDKTVELPELIQTSNFITIKELAEKLKLKLKDIEEKTRALGKEYLTNQILEVDEIKAICNEMNVEVETVSFEDEIFSNYIEKLQAQMVPRASVVTVMGHVDHGKTTLLDTLRNTRIADKEAGGITQKIGAYKLTYKNNDIIFIDTPGHEAFTNIRIRGAKVTDIVVLVVAANDGVQPQTVEAIHHAKAAKVPILVAINKIDLAGADSQKVKQQLTKHDIVVEDWGGDVVTVEISAKKNINLDALLDMINLISEMQELKAYKNIPARGTIIESRLDPQLGPLGTVLIQHGTIRRGDFFICGNSVGKVKSIFDDKGKVLNDAEVPLPVEIMGFEEVPQAGEMFQVTDDADKARKVVELRKQKGKEARSEGFMTDKKLSLQNLFDKIGEDKVKEIHMVVKADNFSSAEVLEKVLLKQSVEQLKINIIYKGIGNITESDILLASTSNAMIVGFNVKAPQKLMDLAKRENVDIKLYSIIYHLIEDIEKAIKGEIAPEYIENLIGQVEVLQIFKISKVGNIAGCLVKEGKVTNKSKIKVTRKNDLVFEGEIETLRRVKNEASEVNAGTECGIRIKNFNSIESGDILEIYERKLKE